MPKLVQTRLPCVSWCLSFSNHFVVVPFYPFNPSKDYSAPVYFYQDEPAQHIMKVLFLAALLSPLYATGNGTLRTIPQGSLQGLSMTSRSGRQFFGFLQIPYANPPLGALRFAMPEKADGWDGVRDATQDGVVCTQRNIYVKNKFYLYGEEDCLYLNVYTPSQNETSKLAVMVWFHGGGWVTGSGNSLYYPPHYLLDKDIVFVGVNYRLGPIGFLSMEDETIPGNWGLKDQNLALKWVRDNIKYFGGDPNAVTIFGESAGGSSVHYHMLSPMSRGLFHRGISQSGTALTSWSLALPGANRNNSLKMGQLLHCPTAPSKALLNCLRSKPVQDIILQDIQFMEWHRDPMIPFKPVVEKFAAEPFLPEHPEDALRAGRVANVPWITGLNSGDGALRTAAVYNEHNLVEELNTKFEEIAPMSLFYRGRTEDVDALTQRIRKFYFGQEPVNNQTFAKATDLWTDAWFLAGAEQAVRLHKQHDLAPVYYYYFSYRGSLSFSAVFGDDTRDFGVCHADELIYLFPMQKLFPDHKYTKADLHHMDVLLQLWTDFAIHGEPTANTEIKWQPVKSVDLEFFHIAEDGLRMETNLLAERSKFWSDLNLPTRLHDEL